MKNIKDKIEDELIDLDLPLQGDAFMYWRELLIYIKNKPLKNRIPSIYSAHNPTNFYGNAGSRYAAIRQIRRRSR